MAVEEAAAVEQEAIQEPPLEPPLFSNGWRIAQALLLVIALTSAVAALILRRNVSR